MACRHTVKFPNLHFPAVFLVYCIRFLFFPGGLKLARWESVLNSARWENIFRPIVLGFYKNTVTEKTSADKLLSN